MSNGRYSAAGPSGNSKRRFGSGTSEMATMDMVLKLQEDFSSFKTQVNTKMGLIQQILRNRNGFGNMHRDMLDKELELVEAFLEACEVQTVNANTYLDDVNDPDYESGDEITIPGHSHPAKRSKTIRKRKPSVQSHKPAAAPRPAVQNTTQNGNPKPGTIFVKRGITKPSVQVYTRQEDPLKVEPEDDDDDEYVEGYDSSYEGVPPDSALGIKIKRELGYAQSSGNSSYTEQKPKIYLPPSQTRRIQSNNSRLAGAKKRKRLPFTMKRRIRVKREKFTDDDSGIYGEYTPWRTVSGAAHELWSHYLRETTGRSAKCKKCDQVIKTYGGTTALWRHISKGPCARAQAAMAHNSTIRLDEDQEDEDEPESTLPQDTADIPNFGSFETEVLDDGTLLIEEPDPEADYDDDTGTVLFTNSAQAFL